MPNFKKPKLTFFYQLESTDCAAACLAMIASFYGRKCELAQVKSLFDFTRIGVSIQDILDVSPKLGLESVALKLTLSELQEIPTPAILYWKQDHFIVLEKIRTRKKERHYFLADPAYGKIALDEETFVNEWKNSNKKGIAIVTETSENATDISLPAKTKDSLFDSLFFKEAASFIRKNKLKYLLSFFLIMLALAANWFIPFTFQKIIDLGIAAKELNVVYFLLLAQLVLFISNFLSDFLSNLILTKINFKLGIGLQNNLLMKLMRLPVNYFDTKLNTETLQRLNDQNTIQNFITWKGIDFVLNVLNILVFGSILLYFNIMIFCVYAFLSIISMIWVFFFLKRRAVLEYAIFLRQSENNNNIYEFIMNMPEIKINNAQTHIVGKILSTVEKLNRLQLRSLFLNMYQVVGINFLSKLKEIIAVAICAIFIINGSMTLGTLLSISYIIGQLASPIQNLASFIRETQDADIANKRIGEIYNNQDEDSGRKRHIENKNFDNIKIENLSFKYPGNYNPFTLNNITFNIPHNSVTALVGASGSGKTTLLKLLLSYYPATEGKILLDNIPINEVYSHEWRKKCGIVLQDGQIFSGTIAENIVFSSEEIDEEKLLQSAKIACLDDFIESLPMGFNTKIGNTGIELSGGQRQRILIARAVYKNPQYLFFDEATSALDAENEKKIHDNLQSFFRGKTVLIIAHRLSTVKNADRIIVLKNGQIAEQGTHTQLVANRANYFNLVKNQLELGS